MPDKLNSNLGVDFGTNSSSSDKGTVKTQVDEDFWNYNFCNYWRDLSKWQLLYKR